LGRTAPEPSNPRAEEDFTSPPDFDDTGASNTGAGSEDAGRAEPLVHPVPKKKKKKKKATASPSKIVPDPSAPATSLAAKETPEAPSPSKGAPSPPPAAPTGKSAAAQAAIPESAQQSLVLHAGRAAVSASEKASAQLGRITELNRGEVSLGPLLEYAERWNSVDLSPATRGLGKDKLQVIDPSGQRSTAQHLSRLKHAVKEFNTAYHDASGNVVVSRTLQTSKLHLYICRFSIAHLTHISSQSPSFGLSTQFLARNFVFSKKPA
jgi:hypothetical protein